MLYEVVAHPKTKIVCHSSSILIFFLCIVQKIGRSYSSQDCGNPVNTSSVLVAFADGRGCRRRIYSAVGKDFCSIQNT
jgi:hypothetical protein